MRVIRREQLRSQSSVVRLQELISDIDASWAITKMLDAGFVPPSVIDDLLPTY